MTAGTLLDFDSGGALDDLDLDDLMAGDPPAEVAEEPAPQPGPPKPSRQPSNPYGGRPGDCLYFDLETIPDFDRVPLFDLPPVPDAEVVETPAAQLPDPEVWVTTDVKAAAQALSGKLPTAVWLDAAEAAERAAKGRKGLLDIIADKRSEKSSAATAKAEREKLLSVTPLYCRIVALGFAVGSQPPKHILARTPADEPILLERFWALADQFRPLVGFNCRSFDLSVILARSVLLNVNPSRLIDRRKYGSRDVLDLMNELYGDSCPKGFGLKRTAKLLGIDVPEDHGDGSQVLRLYEAGEWNAIAKYVEGDVRITQALHREKLSGRFCV